MGEDGMCEELKSCLQEKSLTAGFYEIYLNRLKKKKKEWSLSTG